jgi:steroid delta-isomerase-like uncharacterized protein
MTAIHAKTTMLELENRNAAILAAHIKAEIAFDIEGTLATLTDDCLFEDMPSGMRYTGKAEVRRYYSQWWSAFGNVPSGSRRHVPAGDSLIVETRFVGTHRGVFEGMAPTGRPIDLPVAIFIGFRDGLMSGERFYYDRATLLSQIGTR